MVDGTIRNFCSYECVLTYRVIFFDTLNPECWRNVCFPIFFFFFLIIVNFPLCCNSNLARTQSQTRSTESPLTGTITPPDKHPLPTHSRLSLRTRLQPPTRVTIPIILQFRHWSLPTPPCLPPLSQARLKPKHLQMCCRNQQRVGPLTLPSSPVTSATNNSTSSQCFSATK